MLQLRSRSRSYNKNDMDGMRRPKRVTLPFRGIDSENRANPKRFDPKIDWFNAARLKRTSIDISEKPTKLETVNFNDGFIGARNLSRIALANFAPDLFER